MRLYRVFSGPVGRTFGLSIRPDFVAAVAAMLGVTVFDTLPGLFIGIGVSLLLLLYRASEPHVAELGHVPGTRRQYADLGRDPENQLVPGVLIVRPESVLFFANAEHIRQTILAGVEREKPKGVVLDAETMPHVDVTAVSMLDELAETLGRIGVKLVLARDIGEVRDVLGRAGGPDQGIPAYPTVQAAVNAL